MRLFEKEKKIIKRYLFGLGDRLEWWGDGLGVRGKNLGFLSEEKFVRALQFAHDGNIEGWIRAGTVPQIPWRTHVCCWAASNALRLEGHLVECGVHTGLLSMAICDYLNFGEIDRKLFLFDTFEGLPTDGLAGQEKSTAEKMNGLYFDVYEIAKRNFSRFENVELIRGVLPESLDKVQIEKISYLSIDLNNARYERETIACLWDKLVSGAMVVIDDYAFMGHIPQYDMWNAFATSKNHKILTLPTGQGLLQK